MSDFPDHVFIALPKDLDGSESLVAAFAAEDITESDEVAVYELVSVGRLERTVRLVEHLPHDDLRIG